jgi:hypothetical protein
LQVKVLRTPRRIKERVRLNPSPNPCRTIEIGIPLQQTQSSISWSNTDLLSKTILNQNCPSAKQSQTQRKNVRATISQATTRFTVLRILVGQHSHGNGTGSDKLYSLSAVGKAPVIVSNEDLDRDRRATNLISVPPCRVGTKHIAEKKLQAMKIDSAASAKRHIVKVFRSSTP